MPRTARATEAGFPEHVLHRGNARSEVFHQGADDAAFLPILGEASRRLPMPRLADCLMPNPFHLVLRPRADGDLAPGRHGLLTTHLRRSLKHSGHSGHVGQGRFQACAVPDDEHGVTLVRSVERHPRRAGLVARAEDWPWSSLSAAHSTPVAMPQLTLDPRVRRGLWVEFVNETMTDAEAEAIPLCIRRNRPFGCDAWTRATAARLGLQSSLRARGGQRRAGTEIT
jgi:putative transposase